MAIRVQQSPYIWFDGTFVPWKKAKIHVITHALHYGSGVFEGIRFYQTDKGPAIFRLKEHLERFRRSAEKIQLKMSYTVKELSAVIKELISKNRLSQGYIRPLAFFGEGFMGLDPTGAKSSVMIAVWPWGAYLSEGKIKAHVSNVRRLTPAQTDMRVKISGHYFNSILASQEARRLGYQEAILLDQDGNVAEGPGENIFMVKNGALITPPAKFILPGITRESILAIAQDEGIPLEERMITVKELLNADEAFFAGTAVELSLIKEIDGKKLKHKNAPISTHLKKCYRAITKGKNKNYANWLTILNPY